MKSDDAEDSVVRRLSREDRARLGMDAWEPSLLRRLMQARAARADLEEGLETSTERTPES